MQHPSYNIRLRGLNPVIETDASNMSMVMDQSGTGGDCTFKLARGSNAVFVVESHDDGVQVSATDSLLLPFREPYMAFCTTRGSERMRIDADGVRVPRLTADVHANLVQDWTSSTDAFLPPSASALTNAFLALSNMYVAGGGGGGGGRVVTSSNVVFPALIDSYASTSVLVPPTANALRSVYYGLSNLMASRLLSVEATLSSLRANTSSSSSSSPSSGSSPGDGPSFTMCNDKWLTSVPDYQSRFYFESDGASVFAGLSGGSGGSGDNGGDGSGNGSTFRWVDNAMPFDLAALAPTGHLSLRGGVTASNASSFGAEVAIAGTLGLGGVRLTHAGAFMGVNLLPGEQPACALHVRGAVYSTEQLFALSDQAVKADVAPIAAPLDKLCELRGCTYRRTDIAGQRQKQTGVIAQDVRRVMPDAVHEAADGRLSVAYNSLVALAIESIKELRGQVDGLRRQVAELTSLPNRSRGEGCRIPVGRIGEA